MATWYGRICAVLLIGTSACLWQPRPKTAQAVNAPPPVAQATPGPCPIQGATNILAGPQCLP